MKVTPTEYFKTHNTDEMTKNDIMNVCVLLHTVNLLREELGFPLLVNSGYRPPAYNVSIGGAKNSSHCRAAAIDFADPKGTLKALMTANDNALLKKYNLYMEHPSATKTWCHLQLFPPTSGSRVFMP